MSFSQTVKEELIKYTLQNKKSNISELLAIVNNIGKVSISEDITRIKIVTENLLTYKRFCELIKKIYDECVQINAEELKKTNKRSVYVAIIDNKNIVSDIVDKLVNVKENILDSRAYIRGSFLSIGSITNPEKEYHFEFVNNDIKNAKLIQEVLLEYDITSKIIMRKNDYILYIKESEQISTLLNVIHAHSSLLKLEDIRIKKEMINNVNRVVNCETANLKKTISAAIKQVSDIKRIIRANQFSKLSDGLKEVALARLDDPEASLLELADILGLSKSCINHRIRKLSEISEEIK